MRTVIRTLAVAAVALALASVPAAAQATKSVGVIAGVNFSTFNGSDADLSSIGLSKGSLTGFQGGVFVDIPVGSSLVLEPAAMYIRRPVDRTP